MIFSEIPEVTSIKKILQKIIKKAYNIDESTDVVPTSDFKFGHFTSNICMVLAKKLKLSPKSIFDKISPDLEKSLQKNLDFVKKFEFINPGFLNFFIKENFVQKKVEEYNYPSVYRSYLSSFFEGKTVVIDYSAPNIAKPFGIGHLRSTNIGQAVYNIFKILGWNTIGDNHLGDWGTQFGKLIVAIKKWADGSVSDLSIKDLEKLYVKFHHEAEKHPELVDEGREWFSKLENGDSEARYIWKQCVDISMDEYRKVYDLLDINIDYAYGESFYEDKMPDVISYLKRKKITTISQGALVIEFSNMPPLIVVKSNGATTYHTRDLATVKYRLDTWRPDLIVYEVGADQSLHFTQLFEACHRAGWSPKEGFVHIAHGLMRWKTGKFSTRKGDTVHLEDLIDQCVKKARSVVEKSQNLKDRSQSERDEISRKIAVSAIKFNDLVQDPRRDIVFDWDKLMNLSGDSGPYLQYVYTRCMSLLEKSGTLETKNLSNLPSEICDADRHLLNTLFMFTGKIIDSCLRYSPSVLCQYLIELGQRFNEFYDNEKIIGHPDQDFKLFLVRTTSSVMSLGLGLLGISTLEVM